VDYRKCELTKAMMDRDWPHQVALPTYRCMGHEYLTIRFFCEAGRLSLCRDFNSYRQSDIDITVFCFAERKHAEQFQARFGGELVSPVTRAIAAERLRNGRCINCAD
jgi:hypothetical protein